MSSFVQDFCRPLVQAFAGRFGGSRHGSVDFSVYPDQEFAGIWFVRLLAKRCTGIEVVVDSFTKRVFQFGNRLSVETDNIPDADNAADKNTVFGIKFNASGIAFVGHCVHGFILNCVKKSLAPLTQYRRAALSGCGRWNVARTPSFSEVIEEPFPSTILQPTATSKASMSRHSACPLTGSVKMVLRVFRFLLFMSIVLSKYVSTVNDNAKYFSLRLRRLTGDDVPF